MSSERKIPYATQWITEEDISAVVEALKSDWLTQGPRVAEFERELAVRCGAKYAVVVSNGTAALHLAAAAAGFKAGDEVVTSPITFAASGNCVLYVGAKPVFVDIDPDCLCIHPKRIEEAVSARTRGIIPVHFGGHPCDMPSIREIAERSGCIVIEDAAHALGATYRAGDEIVRVGSCRHSDMTTFSFHAVKHITTGEGGAVTTNDARLYERLLLLRTHGITRDPGLLREKEDGPWSYEMLDLGFNYRLTDIQCALGLSQLRRLESFVQRRRQIAAMYTAAFKDVDEISVQEEKPWATSSYHLYVIRCRNVDRGKVFDELRSKGIGVNVHYKPVYRLPYYKSLGYPAPACPEAEAYYSGAITIPMYPKMTDDDAAYVVEAVKSAVIASRAVR